MSSSGFNPTQLNYFMAGRGGKSTFFFDEFYSLYYSDVDQSSEDSLFARWISQGRWSGKPTIAKINAREEDEDLDVFVISYPEDLTDFLEWCEENIRFHCRQSMSVFRRDTCYVIRMSAKEAAKAKLAWDFDELGPEPVRIEFKMQKRRTKPPKPIPPSKPIWRQNRDRWWE